VAAGVGRLRGFEVMLDSVPVGEGLWLPQEIVVHSEMHVPFRNLRKRNRYFYSEFDLTP
jgi:hypothetical protein